MYFPFAKGRFPIGFSLHHSPLLIKSYLLNPDSKSTLYHSDSHDLRLDINLLKDMGKTV